MAGRRVAGVVGATIFAVAALTTVPSPVAAECPGHWGRWPSFREVAPTAARVVIGRVTRDADPRNFQPGLDGGVPGHAVVNKTLIPNPTGTWRAEWTAIFELEVHEVMRGGDHPGDSIVVSYLKPGFALSGLCGGGAYLSALPGAVMALAFGGHDTRGHTGVNTAAWVVGGEGGECGCALTEAERMTIPEIRRLMGLLPADPIGSARGPVWQR